MPDTEKPQIKAFSFLHLDPRSVADQMYRAGWSRSKVIDQWKDLRSWNDAVYAAFRAQEEASREDN